MSETTSNTTYRVSPQEEIEKARKMIGFLVGRLKVKLPDIAPYITRHVRVALETINSTRKLFPEQYEGYTWKDYLKKAIEDVFDDTMPIKDILMMELCNNLEKMLKEIVDEMPE